jgi:hypothetical protein
MKRLAIDVLLFAATVFLLNACASGGGVVSESSATQSAASVPGEKLPDEPTVVPGGLGSPSAGMRW